MKLLLIISAIAVVAYAKIPFTLDDINAMDFDNNNEMESENSGMTAVLTQNLFIPMTLKTCDGGACSFVCKLIGYAHGTCVSPSTCRCYN